MNKAIFKFEDYQFSKISLDTNKIGGTDKSLSLDFNVSGEYDETKGKFILKFDFDAQNSQNESVIFVSCRSTFSFENPIAIEDIPDFFYPNSIAIIFPYVRAMVSTLTLQANIQPIILPTINLLFLKDNLKGNTTCTNKQ